MTDTLGTVDAEVSAQRSGVGGVLRGLLTLLFTLAVPVLLVLLSVRLVMTPLFLQIEYNRPGFPADVYGFSTADRLRYGPLAVDYLFNGEDIDFLGNLTFANGAPLFNARELGHMEDVKVVTRAAYFMLLYGGLGALILGVLLSRRSWGPVVLWRGLFNGAVLTLALVTAIVFFAVAAWDFFFTAFHQVFFEAGTWTFAYSDTLIRLFPEQLWFDAALSIGVLTVLGALGLLLLSWRVLRHVHTKA